MIFISTWLTSKSGNRFEICCAVADGGKSPRKSVLLSSIALSSLVSTELELMVGDESVEEYGTLEWE